jgi:hypothetical protein
MRSPWQTLSMETGVLTQLAWPVACMALAKFGRRSHASAAACTLAALATLIWCSFANLPLLIAGLGASAIIVAAMLLHSASRHSLALLSRAAFSFGLIETAGTRASFALLRHFRLSVVPATHTAMSLTFLTLAVSSIFGWLALGSQKKQSPNEHGSGYAAVVT